jgi:hypothetical protein
MEGEGGEDDEGKDGLYVPPKMAAVRQLEPNRGFASAGAETAARVRWNRSGCRRQLESNLRRGGAISLPIRPTPRVVEITPRSR